MSGCAALRRDGVRCGRDVWQHGRFCRRHVDELLALEARVRCFSSDRFGADEELRTLAAPLFSMGSWAQLLRAWRGGLIEDMKTRFGVETY